MKDQFAARASAYCAASAEAECKSRIRVALSPLLEHLPTVVQPIPYWYKDPARTWGFSLIRNAVECGCSDVLLANISYDFRSIVTVIRTRRRVANNSQSDAYKRQCHSCSLARDRIFPRRFDQERKRYNRQVSRTFIYCGSLGSCMSERERQWEWRIDERLGARDSCVSFGRPPTRAAFS